MVDDPGLDEDVLVPAFHAVGDLTAGDHNTQLPHLVYETTERMAGMFGLLLILGVNLYRDWEYFHITVILLSLFIDGRQRVGGCLAGSGRHAGDRQRRQAVTCQPAHDFINLQQTLPVLITP